MQVYIALLKPEKNTKENVMCTHHNHLNRNRATNFTQTSCSSSTNISTTSAPSIMINGGNITNRPTVTNFYMF